MLDNRFFGLYICVIIKEDIIMGYVLNFDLNNLDNRNNAERYRLAIVDLIAKGKAVEHDPRAELKIGDRVEFIGGYNDNILFEATIAGFYSDGEILVPWDCYWFGVKRDSPNRKFRVLS